MMLDKTDDKPATREPDRSGPPLPPIDIEPATDEEVARLQEWERDGRGVFERALEQMREMGAGDDGEK